MIGKCQDCGKLKNVNLPSGYDDLWLIRDHPAVKWRCVECYGKAITTNHPVQIDIHKHYLMQYQAVIPFLASIAFIIMTCLEIAWHS